MKTTKKKFVTVVKNYAKADVKVFCSEDEAVEKT